jgi:nitrogen fixation-related uncharacterized protein
MSIKQFDNLTRDEHDILQKAEKAKGQLTPEQAKLRATN